MSVAAMFKQELGLVLAQRLGSHCRFYKSRDQIRWDVADGHHIVTLAGSNKYSPFVGVDFYFGKNFSQIRAIEKNLGIYSFPCHVQQYSPNFSSRGLGTYHGPCTWSVDLNNPPSSLADELIAAIEGLTLPFFEAYGTLLSARDAIAANERDVFGGPMFWGQLLRLDLALDDLEHFRSWSTRLDELSRSQAEEIINKYVAIVK
ncbi:MAG: hypothetical protein ACJ8R9_30395 [Steroidobacteraceae bacterium]